MCTTLAAWHLKKVALVDKERGLIINVSSRLASHGFPGVAAYSASKRAIEAMLLPVARELGQHKIRLLNIAPGLMKTAMSDVMPEEERQRVAALNMRGQLGEAHNFA